MKLANQFLVVGVIYGLIGMLMGMAMGFSQNFSLATVHAHVSLLGWVSMVLFGLIYRAIPAMAAEPLARWQFWLSNLGLIVMMITLTMAIGGNGDIVTVLALSELVVVLGMVLFAWLVWRHRKA